MVNCSNSNNNMKIYRNKIISLLNNNIILPNLPKIKYSNKKSNNNKLIIKKTLMMMV